MEIVPLAEKIRAYVSSVLSETGIDPQSISDRIVAVIVEQTLRELFG